MDNETKPTCPNCGSDLVIRIANMLHCNSCAFDFDIEKNQVARIERFPWSGWPPRPTLKNP